MQLTTYFTNVVQPELQRIGTITICKWGIYLLEVISASQIFGTIYDKLRFRIAEHTYCFAYGNESRCNFGVKMSFLGLITAMYTLTLSVFSEYMNIPPMMKWSEYHLCGFKFGIWLITNMTLDSWFRRKFEHKYRATGRPEDRLERIIRMDSMIGKDVRKVRQMARYTLLILLISTLIIQYHDKKKQDNRKQEKMTN